MNIRLLLAAKWLWGGLLCLATAHAGEVTGRILFSSPGPTKPPAAHSWFVRHLAAASTQPAASGEFRRTAVFLETLSSPDTSTTAEPQSVKVTVKGRRFQPEVVTVPVDSQVAFRNADAIFHSLFSLSRSKPFDLGNYGAGESRGVRFDKPGVVQVYCRLHPQMNTTVLVVPTQWHTQPREDGTFTFLRVPAGTYQAVAWHNSAGFFRKRIKVPRNGSIEISFQVPTRD